MKDVSVKVSPYEDHHRSPPASAGDARSYTVELLVGKHRFTPGFYTFPSKEEASRFATEVRRSLGLTTSPAELTLSKEELEKAAEFTLEHPYACGVSNDFSVRYTASGVGTKKLLTCLGCQKEEDVTDYDSW